jgi:hypothetical protein
MRRGLSAQVSLATKEVLLKRKTTSISKKAGETQKPDLRNGLEGSLTVNGVEAGAVPPGAENNENLATPDFSVPIGQTTHE